MSTKLKSFLSDLATDPEKHASFLSNPTEAMTAAGLDAGDQAALRSGNPAAIYGRLAGGSAGSAGVGSASSTNTYPSYPTYLINYPVHVYPPIHVYPPPVHIYPPPVHIYPPPLHIYPPVYIYPPPPIYAQPGQQALAAAAAPGPAAGYPPSAPIQYPIHYPPLIVYPLIHYPIYPLIYPLITYPPPSLVFGPGGPGAAGTETGGEQTQTKEGAKEQSPSSGEAGSTGEKHKSK